MLGKISILSLIIVLSVCGEHRSTRRPAADRGTGKWRCLSAQRGRGTVRSRTCVRPAAKATTASPLNAASGPPAEPTSPRQPIARVTEGNGSLPNDAGQVWREYGHHALRRPRPRLIGPSRPSSIGFCATRATKPGIPSRSAFLAPIVARCASITRPRCRPRWPTSSIAS